MALTYQAAVEQTITAGEQIHQIVNGTATTEVTVEDGSKVPSIRKALLDNFYFKDPIAWQVGQTENVFNQLRQFTDGSWWYAPSATASNPIYMGGTPVGDSLWKIYDFDAIGKLTPQLREALRRSYAEAGYNLVDGSFEEGGILTSATDVLLHKATGIAYSGTIGSVAAGTDPAAVGSGYVPSTDATLRSDLYLHSLAGGASLVARLGEGDVNTYMQRAAGEIEGRYNLRNFYNALYGLISGTVSFTVASYGDSVSPRVAEWLWLSLKNRFGDGGLVTGGFGTPRMGTIIPTVTSPASWDAIDATTANSANFTYLPNGGHITIPSTGVAMYDSSQTKGFSSLKVFFAKEPGAGTALVEVLNRDTGIVQASATVDCSNTSLDLLTQSFTGLTKTAGIKVRVTGITGTVTLLCVAFLRDYGVVHWHTGRGGTTYTQQNQSSMAILTGMAAALNATLMMHEVKEEGVEPPIAAHFARMALLTNTDHITIASLPDSREESSQLTVGYIQRKYAAIYGQGFFDGYAACKNYAEMQRLSWNGDGTHLDNRAYYHVASTICQNLNLNETLGGYVHDNIKTSSVEADTMYLRRTDGPQTGASIPFASWAGGGTPTMVYTYNIRKLVFNGAVGSGPFLEGYGPSAITFRNASDNGYASVRASNLELLSANTDTGQKIAGGASPLPATPAGYMAVNINGVTRWMPYY